MREDLNYCPKCKQLESYLFNSFDECVAYTHCQCKKPKPMTGDKKPLDLAFNELDKYFHKKYDFKRRD